MTINWAEMRLEQFSAFPNWSRFYETKKRGLIHPVNVLLLNPTPAMAATAQTATGSRFYALFGGKPVEHPRVVYQTTNKKGGNLFQSSLNGNAAGFMEPVRGIPCWCAIKKFSNPTALIFVS